ncbi:HAD-IA family hydrolase [Cellulosimicrobium protaetiae]|uniref:HAD-IA family hydrolase n=1 Tax=Cellulosimicrobium protaetiae TaxID=2587808 RepID=A0A6M5UA45_9MICO|nr:HAD-IA family hydrolase [Cellulosimicrobium protaetiae]QJW35090.1 HAD-IA family hydrolase [Cellulosimicrobium protaetiae]
MNVTPTGPVTAPDTWAWRGAALLLDLDGTLVDSTAAIDRHTLAWAARLGLDGDAVVAASHGRRDVEVVRLVAPGADVAREVEWLHRISCDDTEGVVAVPGAAELLDDLDPRAWTVVTSAAREVALARLTAAGLPVPARFVCAEDVARGKPDPEGFLAGARLLGVDPRRCLVLEDSAAGVAAGRDATATVLAVGPDDVPGAHHAVADLRPVVARAVGREVEVVVTTRAAAPLKAPVDDLPEFVA